MMDAMQIVRGETGIIYDDRMAQHRCLWDSKFPECPERFTRVVERSVDKLIVELECCVAKTLFSTGVVSSN